jgi:hypothetical protein
MPSLDRLEGFIISLVHVLHINEKVCVYTPTLNLKYLMTQQFLHWRKINHTCILDCEPLNEVYYLPSLEVKGNPTGKW